MPEELADDTKDALFEMLDEGATASEIADELDVAERTVYNYKDEWEERNEIKKRVSRSQGVTAEQVISKAENVPGLGGQTADALEQALSMNDSVLKDPNELYRLVNQVTDLDAYWIDFLVRSVYPDMDSSSAGGGGGSPQGQPQYHGVGGGQDNQQSPPPRYPNPQQNQGQVAARGAGQARYQPPQGQQARPAGGQGTDPRVEELEEKVDEIGQMFSQFMQQQQQEEQSSQAGMVEIETDDGNTVRLPADHPRVSEYLGSDSTDDFMQFLTMAKEIGLVGDDDGGDDFLEQVTKMKEAGIIDDNDEELVEVMSEQISEGIQAMNQSQQQMMGNMQQTLQQIAEVASEDEDENITREDIEQILQEKQEKSEIEQLKERLERQNKEFRQMLKKTQASGDASPEMVKTQKGYELREKQIDTAAQTMKEAPQVAGETVQNTLLPVLQMLQPEQGSLTDILYQHPDQAGGEGITYDPQESRQQPRRQAEPQQMGEPEPRESGPQDQQRGPETGEAPAPERADEGDSAGDTAQYAQEVSEKLLDTGDESSEEAEA